MRDEPTCSAANRDFGGECKPNAFVYCRLVHTGPAGVGPYPVRIMQCRPTLNDCNSTVPISDAPCLKVQ
jgi:hypothetical protein